MKNIINISYKEIKNYLEDNQIVLNSKISNTEQFTSLNSLLNANQDELTFMNTNSSINVLSKTKAKACLIHIDKVKYLPNYTMPIIVNNPYKAFALLSNLFANDKASNGIISNLSALNKNIKLHKNIQIDEFVSIKENCEIGNNVIIGSNCSIGPNVTIAENSVIKSNVSLINCHIGSNCIVKSGAIIGGSGFGFDPISKTRIYHYGNVIIENNCNIGSNTTIDRAVFDSTIISENCFIDNLVHISHNVILGKGCIIAAQTGIAGSTILGENVTIGGQAGISGHLKIGNNVKIAAKSGVTKDIKHDSTVAGFPAIDIKKWKIANINLYKQNDFKS